VPCLRLITVQWSQFASIRWTTVSSDYPTHDLLPNDMPHDLRESYMREMGRGHHTSKLRLAIVRAIGTVVVALRTR
jgi:hypothetical protein